MSWFHCTRSAEMSTVVGNYWFSVRVFHVCYAVPCWRHTTVKAVTDEIDAWNFPFCFALVYESLPRLPLKMNVLCVWKFLWFCCAYASKNKNNLVIDLFARAREVTCRCDGMWCNVITRSATFCIQFRFARQFYCCLFAWNSFSFFRWSEDDYVP